MHRSNRSIPRPVTGHGVSLGERRPLFTRMRCRYGWLRAIAVFVAAAFLNLYLQPLALAAQLPARPAPKTPSNEERLSQTIETIETRLEKLEAKLERHEDAAKETNALNTLRRELDALDAQALEDFASVERHIKGKKLPSVILERHNQAIATYKQEMAALKANLDTLNAAKDDSERALRAKRASEHLEAKHGKRGARVKFDPNDLPNKSLQPNRKNKPKLSKQDFARAGLTDNPTVRLAALGDFKFDRLPGASDPIYLAETTEIVLTDAVKAKAAELDHNPVKIYDWVLNNVEWLPTWGAQQDADVTLGSQRGNAIDIASLLIALLRASGIPSRYAHGTIEVPADKFMNWTGGFTNINAALDYASAGGIPLAAVQSGGKITKVQLEHIWVEAAVDFHPSRGAINKSADSWVALDPSYKQYQDLQGLDVVQIAGIDSNALAQSFASSGIINTQEGWVQNLNPTILQNAQTQAQTALTNYINTNLPNATVGDVIGGRRIVTQTRNVLPSGLPYRLIASGAKYGALPRALENTMTFAFGTDPIGEPINPITFPWPALNNHKLTLSFKPATSADAQTLASFLPQGSVTDLNQLPDSIPAYLIFVVPELMLDGNFVGQGNAMQLGQDLNFSYDIERVGGIGSQTYSYPVIAGSYESVMVGGGSTSSLMMKSLYARLQQTGSVLGSGNPEAIEALDRDALFGDLFNAGTLSYFSEYLALCNSALFPQNARHNLPVGYGTFGFEPDVQQLFGIPRAIHGGGIAVNVRLSSVLQSLDGDSSKRAVLGLETGMISSALEHSVPEQMFSDSIGSSEAVSAVKAYQLAGLQRQRVYHITSANQAQIIPTLGLDTKAIGEISQAIAVGKEAIAHTNRISVSGWTGEGYVLFDPITGDGAYKIAGGSNGGFMKDFTKLYVDVLTVVNLKDWTGVLSGFTKIFKGGLTGLGLGFTFAKVLDDCGPEVAIALTAVSYFIGQFISKASIALALSGVGLLGAIFIAVIGFLINSLIQNTIVSLTTQLCHTAKRRNGNIGYA